MADKKSKPRGLGRGLSALMADVGADQTSSSEPTQARTAEATVPIEKLVANPDQPRRHFSEEHLQELTNSIKEKGVLQPLIVRPKGEMYEIVAGERRWRAAQRAQVHQIPVIVRDLNDTEVLEIAIIENIQRADLNAIEEAAGYRQLMDKFGHTQEKLAEALGKSRSHIANLLRLLGLPQDVQALLQEGKLSAGHARALITAENPSLLAKTVVAGGLSVRATEALVKKAARGDEAPTAKPATKQVVEKDADTKALEGDLSAALGMKVTIDHKPDGEAGQVTIKYINLDQLDVLCGLLSR